MATHVTKKQVQDEFASFENALHVVLIDKNDPLKRSTHISGLNLHAAFAEMATASMYGLKFLLFTDAEYKAIFDKIAPAMRHTWDIEPYTWAAELFKKSESGTKIRSIGRIR